MANEVIIKFTGESGQFIKELEKVAAQFKNTADSAESLKERLGSVLSNKNQVNKSFADLSRLAEKTEISIEELTDEFVRLQSKGLKNAAAELERMTTVARSNGQTLSQVARDAEAAERGFTTLAVAAGGYAALLGGLASQAVSTGLNFERLQTALTTSLGSEGAAEQAFANILEFAKQTPFQVQEITEAFIKLKNRGIEPTNETLARLGDIASGQGKSLDQITEALLDAVVGEGERLKEFGIRASFAGDQATLSFKGTTLEVAKTEEAIAEAILSFGELEGVAGGMNAQAATLGGSLSNLQDGADQVSLAFFELTSQGIKPVVDGANTLINGFLALPPVYQKALLATTAFTGVLAAAASAIVAYNAVNGQKIIGDVLAAASTVKTTVVTKAKTAADVAAALATNTLTVAQARSVVAIQAQALAIGALLLKLAALVAAIEVARQTFNILGDGGENTRDRLREFQRGIEQLGVEAEETGAKIERIQPQKAGFFDIFRTGARNNIDDTRIAIADFSQGVLNTVDGLGRLGSSAEDVAQKQQGFAEALKAVDAEIAALDEKKLGTDAYEELRGRLDVTRAALLKQGEAYGLTANEAEAATATTEDQTAALQAQTDAIQANAQAQAEAARQQREAEKEATAQQREDEGVALSRQREDEKRARDEAFQAELAALQEAQAQELAALQSEQQESLQADQAAFQAELDELQKQQQEEEQAIARQFDAEQQALEKEFNAAIEQEKNTAATARLEAERALAEQIATRLEAQAASFKAAEESISRTSQLLSAQTAEERKALEAEFKRLDEQAKRISELNLADQVFTPDALLNLAQQVAGVTSVKTEEDAKRIQEALAALEAEQKAQQAELDKQRQEAQQVALQEKERLFQEQLNLAQEEFNLAQEQRKLELEAQQQLRQQENEAIATQLKLEQEQFLEEKRRGFEAQLAALKDQQESALQAKQKAFDESERNLQRAFEDAQRAKERAFNAQERQKDEASAQRIAAILRSARQSAPTPRLKGGPVVPGTLYLGGEKRPEPVVYRDGSMGMVGLNGPELFRVDKPGMVFPKMEQIKQRSPQSDPLLSELKALNQKLTGTTMGASSDTYNIVGAQDPVAATIKLQTERIRQRVRIGRL